MRATKTSVFLEAAAVALIGLYPAWAMTAGIAAIVLSVIPAVTAPRLVPVPAYEHALHIKTAESEFRHGVPDGGSSLPVLYRIEKNR